MQFSDSDYDDDDDDSDYSTNDDDDDADVEDELEDDDDEDDEDDGESEPTETIQITHRISLVVSHTDSIVDFTVEELDPDEMSFDSDTSVVQPSQLEEASSSMDEYDSDTSESESEDGSGSESGSLADDFEGLNCGLSKDFLEQEREIAAAREERYSRRHKRWRKGGNKKRRIDHNYGPGFGNEDVVPLEDDQRPKATTDMDRRLRRKTEEPTNRPQMHDILRRAVPGLGDLGEVMLEDDDGEDPDEVMPPSWMFEITEVDMDVEATPGPGWQIVQPRRRRKDRRS